MSTTTDLDAIHELSFYDSYQKKIKKIQPNYTVVPGCVELYSCGPTVYHFQHIGNYRAAWFPDMIARVAMFGGWQVRWVMNITDVGHIVGDGDSGQNIAGGEDKIEKGAKRDGKSVKEIVDMYTSDFLLQCRRLGINLPEGDLRPMASEYIKEQMLIALELVKKKRAYFLEDGIYFDSRANKDLKLPFKIQQEGSNEFTDRDIKNVQKSPADFALWKFVDPASLQQWNFGQFPEALELLNSIVDEQKPPAIMSLPGCPGWHTECVAMIGSLFGEFKGKGESQQNLTKELTKEHTKATFSFAQLGTLKSVIDIHTGGEDHIDVHHKNEILQSSALGFHLSRLWVHNKFVVVDGKKMSKSLGTSYILKDIMDRDFDPLAYRMLMHEHHYTQQLDFTWDKLTQANARLLNLRKDISNIRSLVESDKTYQYTPTINPAQKQLYLGVVADNLNIPMLLEKFQKLVNEVLDRVIKEKNFNESNINLIRALDNELLALDLWPEIPTQIKELAELRLEAKKAKNYEESDKIRDQIKEKGYDIGDYPQGYGVWKVR